MKVYAQKQSRPQQKASLHPSPFVQHKSLNQAVPVSSHADAEKRKEVTSTSAPSRFAHDFSRIPAYSRVPVSLQAKLKVNTPGDIYEQEADRVSELMTSMSEPQLQRTCACGGGCPKCQTEQPGLKHERLQTKHTGPGGSGQTPVPPIVHEVLRSPGQPLDAANRSLMESRFGYDFGQVRVHTDARAARSAQAVSALAYTVGRNIVMGADQFQPQSKAGQRLLAHELTHVIQQNVDTTGYSSSHLSHGYHRPEAELKSLAVERGTINYPLRITAAPTAIYRQGPLLEPPIVTQFREVGQLVPTSSPGMTALRNPPVNVPPTGSSEPAPSPTPQPTPPSGPSPQIVYFLMRHEGFYAHPDDVSDPYNCTVGYGHLLHHGTCVGNDNAAERRFARGITQEEALSMLVRRLMRDANYLLPRLTAPVSQNQFDALLSFAFNPGGGLGSLIAHINRGEYAAVPGIMLRFTGAATTGGQMAHPRGLARRRAEEAAVWERGDYGHGTARRHHGCRRTIEDCSNREHPRPRAVTPLDQS